MPTGTYLPQVRVHPSTRGRTGPSARPLALTGPRFLLPVTIISSLCLFLLYIYMAVSPLSSLAASTSTADPILPPYRPYTGNVYRPTIPSSSSFRSGSGSKREREAYVTFLSARTTAEYLTYARLLLFSLKHDPSTSDPLNRDVVVLHPPGLPAESIAQLREEGAIVLERPVLDRLPAPEGGWKSEWSEVYTKLHIFNLTQYDRVVYYDADHLVLRPVHGIWDAKASHPPSGLASLGSGEGGNVPGSGYFLAGFFLAIPSERLMRDLVRVRDYDPVFPEQNLLNKYFDQNGTHPWVELDEIHERISPTEEHVSKGYHTVHEKLAKWGPEGFRKLYWEKIGRMEMFWSLHRAADER